MHVGVRAVGAQGMWVSVRVGVCLDHLRCPCVALRVRGGGAVRPQLDPPPLHVSLTHCHWLMNPLGL